VEVSCSLRSLTVLSQAEQDEIYVTKLVLTQSKFHSRYYCSLWIIMAQFSYFHLLTVPHFNTMAILVLLVTSSNLLHFYFTK
jgi:hypothetical protein